MTIWTPERVTLLDKLWREGRSCSQIAAEIGGVSRNAVIGKLHRLGLNRVPRSGPKPSRPPKPESAATPPRRAPKADVEKRAASPAAPRIGPAVEATVSLPASTRVTIVGLRDSMCSWPIGDPRDADFAYCGARRARGVLAYPGAKRAIPTPYCAEHHRIAHQPRSVASSPKPRAIPVHAWPARKVFSLTISVSVPKGADLAIYAAKECDRALRACGAMPARAGA